MREEKSQFIKDLLKKKSDGQDTDKEPFTSERQLTAQALNLHLQKRTGLHSEGFGWSHYARYKWTDEGTHERLAILFGGAGAVEIEGHNLGLIVEDIRQGKLNGIEEMITADVQLKRANGHKGAIISSVKMYPDFDELFKEIKGDDHEPGFAGKVRGR
jgi:hypothetical protein